MGVGPLMVAIAKTMIRSKDHCGLIAYKMNWSYLSDPSKSIVEMGVKNLAADKAQIKEHSSGWSFEEQFERVF